MSDRLNINIAKRLGAFTLEVKQSISLGGITAIFGPSGAGKSSLLKLITGFEIPDRGHISLKEKIWFDSADKINHHPHKRRIGYMFQDGRLFPHMTVRGNLIFALKRAPREFSLETVISSFGIEALLDHNPQILSGGEQRRVALARTVLTAPDILLLDEPLTGLDRARKRDILPFIESLPREFNIPCLYVTHDIEEVSRLADRVIVMSEGRISAHGATATILGQLDTTPLHSDYDVSSHFEGRVSQYDDALHLAEVDIGGVSITLPLSQDVTVGDALRLRIRAADIALAVKRPAQVSVRNIFKAQVTQVTENAETAYAMVTLDLNGQDLRARITRASLQDLSFKQGQIVYAMVKSVSFEGRL